MVRELKFDVSEMAIATFVQAKAYGKPLVLIPATVMGRFQHGAILCNAARPLAPAELAGKRVGVRAYSQTTAVWVRGILENDYGVDLGKVRWVTFEDGHVAEYREPDGVERASGDKNLLKMLRDGELDAAIYGADLPKDPALTSLIPDPDNAARTWYARHKVVPINHMVVVTKKLARSDPQAVTEIYRLLRRAKAARTRAPSTRRTAETCLSGLSSTTTSSRGGMPRRRRRFARLFLRNGTRSVSAGCRASTG